ncbi:hypothetical protein P170DRAFT_275524 [Aspergillus steynii IBT 23096]|uniref:Uncharacterized protein n=1 Tax=Aspergillus steynii IBT 23096 TaxID=1392250 RepID=A0A2I2FX50_9EURO|nr:uncharacterized protein P170DRAFT_275524 [Aspergillus steynii IBT 23096]PLB45219.1 hypothetical protein P170DRAFT_275524 [Aspergillus steynii IBT 23096]
MTVCTRSRKKISTGEEICAGGYGQRVFSAIQIGLPRYRSTVQHNHVTLKLWSRRWAATIFIVWWWGVKMRDPCLG